MDTSGSGPATDPTTDDPTDPDELVDELDRAADAPQLLVVSDFDGVLAPFVDDPDAAAPVPESLAALRVLAGTPDTTVAIVSGRGRDDLAARCRSAAAIELVGSHGAEWSDGFATPMGDADRDRLAGVVEALEGLAADVEGAFVETKQASAALHYRRVEQAAERERLRSAALAGPAQGPGVHVTDGKDVVEIAVVETDKGTALRTLRERAGAEAVTVFCGDDVTDERGFAVLGPDDLGVKVGPGPTRARLRVEDLSDVTELYTLLATVRRRRTGARNR